MATSSPIQERPTYQSGFRRSFTPLPRALSYHEKAGLDPSDSAAEILYSHPSARIVKFSPPDNAIRSVSTPIPQDLDYPVDTIETLPWASTTETTMASGLLIVEKVKGSTNFLKSGNVMHAILRNSQCWCVDGASKFVLRIAKFNYYRIELPTNSDEDRTKVEELKELLKKILRFERTPCPFKRGFHVDLPDSDITPRRKGIWKRRQSSQVSALIDKAPSPLRPGRNFTKEGTQHGNPFDKIEPEEEPFANGSDYDEDEIHSESDSHEEHDYHPSVAPISEPRGNHLGKADANVNENIPTLDDETTNDELDGHQKMPDLSTTALAQSPMLPTKPTEVDEKEELQEEEEAANSETDNSQIIADVSTSTPQQPEMAPVESPSPKSCLVKEGTESIREADTLAPEVDGAEVDSSTAEGYAEADAQLEAASLAIQNPSGSISGQPSVSHTFASEHAQVEIVNEEQQTRVLDQIGLDVASGPPEMQSDSTPIDTMSIASTSNSFHSFDASESPTSTRSLSPSDSPPSPTPLAETFDPLAMHSHHSHHTHKRDVSELTITPSSPALKPLSRLTTDPRDRPSTSASDGSWTEVETPSEPHATNQIRHRLNTRRSLSPLPPSPTLFRPSPQQDRSNHLTSTILQKACSLALGKPVEVVVMLVHILARIAGGATVNDLLDGNLFKKPGQEREHLRNRNLPDQIDGKGDDTLDEDDFGVPIRGRARSSGIAKADDETDSLFDLD